jgi:hypothetical protein
MAVIAELSWDCMKIGYWYKGFGCQVPAQPPAKKTAGQIEKETMNNRMTNDE